MFDLYFRKINMYKPRNVRPSASRTLRRKGEETAQHSYDNTKRYK